MHTPEFFLILSFCKKLQLLSLTVFIHFCPQRNFSQKNIPLLHTTPSRSLTPCKVQKKDYWIYSKKTSGQTKFIEPFWLQLQIQKKNKSIEVSLLKKRTLQNKLLLPLYTIYLRSEKYKLTENALHDKRNVIEHNKLKELGNKTQIFSTEIEKECACPGKCCWLYSKSSPCIYCMCWHYKLALHRTTGKNLDKERISVWKTTK